MLPTTPLANTKNMPFFPYSHRSLPLWQDIQSHDAATINGLHKKKKKQQKKAFLHPFPVTPARPSSTIPHHLLEPQGVGGLCQVLWPYARLSHFDHQ